MPSLEAISCICGCNNDNILTTFSDNFYIILNENHIGYVQTVTRKNDAKVYFLRSTLQNKQFVKRDKATYIQDRGKLSFQRCRTLGVAKTWNRLGVRPTVSLLIDLDLPLPFECTATISNVYKNLFS